MTFLLLCLCVCVCVWNESTERRSRVTLKAEACHLTGGQKEAMAVMVLGSCYEGRWGSSKGQTQTNAGLHICTAKATGLKVLFFVVFVFFWTHINYWNQKKKGLHFSVSQDSILTKKSPNSRQVYTCVSSADRLCISLREFIRIFFVCLE